MITQAAFEYRQRDDTASPITQAEEQVAIGRPAVRTGLGRGETQLHAICRFVVTVDRVRACYGSWRALFLFLTV